MSKPHLALGAGLIAVAVWVGCDWSRSPNVTAWSSLDRCDPPSAPAARPKSIRCTIKRLPGSALGRRNMMAALRRLDGMVIGPGERVCLSSALGPWTGPDYVFAPSGEDGPYVGVFGGGAQKAGAAAIAAAQASGLTLEATMRPSACPPPSPIAPEQSLLNPTGQSVRFGARWKAGRPIVIVEPCAATEISSRAADLSLPVERSQILAAVGDITCDPSAAPGIPGAPNRIDGTLAGLLREADVVIANLESPITQATEPTPLKSEDELRNKTEFLFKGDPTEAIGLLQALGVDIASLANNHIFDYRDRGISDTREALTAAGISGAGPGADDVGASFRMRGRDIRLTALVTTETLPPAARATLNRTWVLDTEGDALAEAKSRVGEQIRASRRRQETAVASFHWGEEGTHEPTSIQRTLARAAASAGAALVIGHHPHTLQAIDAIDGTVVAYSLGNFVFASSRRPQALSGVLIVELVGGRAVAAGLVPVAIDPDGLPRLITDMSGEQAERIAGHLGIAG